MKSLSVGEAKAAFSHLLDLVRGGETIQILYGKSRRPVARIVPIPETGPKRRLGVLEGKASFTESGNGKMTEAEFLGA